MRHAATLGSIALAVLLATVGGARAESICDSLPSDAFDGVAVVTAVRHTPDQAVDSSPDYEVSPDLTGRDGALLGALPAGYSESTGNADAQRMPYHVDCAMGQDTVFTVTNLEIQDIVTVLIEYFVNGRPIFTQGSTLRPGHVMKLSASRGLAQSF
jgi:hypothetical protein